MSTREAIRPQAFAPLGRPIATKVFADGADVEGIVRVAQDPRVSGFTTNPTLMRKAGIADYAAFARELLEQVPDHPISFEVFADEPAEIRRQATLISSWGQNVYVKIPITTTGGESTASIVKEVSGSGVQVNVTALMLPSQVEVVADALKDGAPSCISVFAGRIADAGIDPLPIMQESLEIMRVAPAAELIWASPREVLNLIQADSIGCHIITMTHDLLAKLDTLGKDLAEFSLDTVKMFHCYAAAAGYVL